jgi:hypothetical protein
MGNGAVDGGSTGAKLSPRPRIRLSPIGFWSYSRNDDIFSQGRISKLRSLLLAELRTQYGRDDVQLFQDVSEIQPGADWERATSGAVDQSTFFIPVVSPFYLQSEWCAREAKMFEARERMIFDTYPDLPRDRRRIFPLLWIDVREIDPVDEEAFTAVRAAQWSDFTKLRHRNLEQDEEVLAKVAAFAKSIVDVLQRRVEAPLGEEEKAQIAREAEEAQRRAEEERERQEVEARDAKDAKARASRHGAAVAAQERRRRGPNSAAAERAGQDQPSLPRKYFLWLGRCFRPPGRWIGAAIASVAAAVAVALFAVSFRTRGSPEATAGNSQAASPIEASAGLVNSSQNGGSSGLGSHEANARPRWLTGPEVRQWFLSNYLCIDFHSATNDCDWLVYGLPSSMTDASRFETRLDRKYEVRDASIARRSYELSFDPDFVVVSSIEQMTAHADRVCATDSQPDFGNEPVFFGSTDGRMAGLTGSALYRFRDAFGTYRAPRRNAQDCWRYQLRHEGGETRLYQFFGNSSASGRWFTVTSRDRAAPSLRIARWGQ